MHTVAPVKLHSSPVLSWNVKFRKNVNNHVNINGCTTDIDIANEFADHFSKVYYNSHEDWTSRDSYYSDHEKCKQVSGERIGYCIESVSVELVDKCIHDLKKGKACGPDDLTAEHLLYAHPSLVVHLTMLFKAILIHGFVPDSFGAGICVPLIKDKIGYVNDINNYRIITLSPIIAKLFEMVVLSICDEYFVTDPLQFGFKRNMGCSDAIFALRCTIEQFTQCGSSIYAASLDIRKAFDTVHHFKLYRTLLSCGVPWFIVDVLCNWYSKMFVVIRWNGALSRTLCVQSGVRQGGCMSPTIFNMFINAFIVQLRQLSVGCFIGTEFVGCLLYADDIILLSPSIVGLQRMLDKCSNAASVLSLQFNTSKSHCIVFGKTHKATLPPMLLDGMVIKFDIMPCKREFYSACNVFSCTAPMWMS